MNYLKDIIYNQSISVPGKNLKNIAETNELIDKIYKANNIKNLYEYLNKVKKNIDIIFSDIAKISEDKKFVIFLNELNILIVNYLDEYVSLKKFNYQGEDNSLENKLYYFGDIDHQLLNNIINISHKHLENFKKKAKLGLTSREDLTLNRGRDIRKIIKILNKFFEKNGDLKKISSYMKQEYNVGMCALELSVPNSTWWKNDSNFVSDKTWYAHLDQEKLYPKSIMYLSDVNENNGPTSFYPKVYSNYMNITPLQDLIGRVVSNIGNNKKSFFYNIFKYQKFKVECEIFKFFFCMLPDEIRFENHFGWFIKKNTRLEDLLVKNEIKMLGPSGSYVVFDGSKLLHRGGLIKENFRSALQIVFTPKESFVVKILKKYF